MGCVVAALMGGAVATAQNSDPVLVEGAMPKYPAQARVTGVQGTVVVEALIDEQGRVFAAEVVESVSRELDRAALAAVSGWTFQPAMEDGKPVMRVVRIPIQFELVHPAKDSMLRGRCGAMASK